jgi:hypothetical protein
MVRERRSPMMGRWTGSIAFGRRASELRRLGVAGRSFGKGFPAKIPLAAHSSAMSADASFVR